MTSPPPASSLGMHLHPSSPRLHPDDPPLGAAEPSSGPDPSIPSFWCSTLALSSLPSSSSPPECGRDDEIAAWRETTPLARLLAHHRRAEDAQEESAQAPAGAQNTSATSAREPTGRAAVDQGASLERRGENGGQQEQRSDEKGRRAGDRTGTARR